MKSWLLVAAGIDPEALYEDKASGKTEDRPHRAACLKAVRDGDTLVVWKLDRLGRDLRHLINIVHDLTDRGVGLKVLTGQGAAIDTTTASGKLVFGIFAALAEFERTHLRTHPRRPRLGPRPRPERWPAIQDDSGEGPSRHGVHGPARNQGRRAV